MESGWERTEAALTIDRPTLQAMVAAMLPAYRVVESERVSGGLANTTYRLTCSPAVIAAPDTPPEVLALRIYQRDELACPRELALYQRVRQTVPVPPMLAAEPRRERFNWPFSLSRWVEGSGLRAVLSASSPAEKHQIAAALGETLASIHEFTFPAAGFLEPDLTVGQTQAMQTDSLLAYLHSQLYACGGARTLGEREADTLYALVTRNATRLERGKAVLLHGDYKPSNLLMRHTTDGWRVAAVLDWEFAFAGDPLFDIGILLRDPVALPEYTYPSFVDGYTRAGGTLPSDWLPVAHLHDCFNLAMFLATSAPDSVRGREVTARVNTTLHLLTSLGW